MSPRHPRRSTKTSSPALTPTASTVTVTVAVNTNMSLHKGATFHSPSTPEDEQQHPFKVPDLPRRSQSSLEDVVDAHKRRVALTLGDIDRSLAAVEDRSPTARQSFPDEADPVPQGFLDHTVGSQPSTKSYGPLMAGVMSEEATSIGRHSLRPRRRPSRYSDSALGSSIGSRSGKNAEDTAPTSVVDDGAKPTTAAKAITRSAAAAHTATMESLPRLSARASNRIREHVLRPLLAKSSLKDFHPIVKDCPRRIHSKEIVCLRDLEKTLIFMAPVSDIPEGDAFVGGVAHWFSRLKERTKSTALYLDFCLTSIRCIQATVEYLSDREQTRPHDRPYTNGYFLDLVDQIKQYAQQVQAAKEKEEKGEKLDEMDPESTDEVRLHGGLTKNGRPAELVRVKKNGKAISVATGLPIDLEDEDSKGSMRFKRSLSQEAEDDDAVMRSMARRKRSASATELAPKRCREAGCDKEFKRPCDLTKHEKTHSRPWKCPVETCKYYEYGWPTEKEMDRHHNDKHSSAPPLYECHFKPCPYRSKRESNCKQHMEKAHGWEYVRSKNNGKNRENPAGTTTTNHGLVTPQTTNIQTPSSDGHSMATPPGDDFDMHTGYGGSLLYDQQQNQLNFPEYPSDIDMFASNQQLQLDFSPISDLNQSGSSNGHSPPFSGNVVPGQDHFQDTFHHLQNNVDFSLFENEDLYSANVRIPTPPRDVYHHAINGYQTSGIPFGADPIPQISPIGHGNTMLYTPTSMREVDEGFEDFVPANCNPQLGNSGDFQLFPASTGGTVASSAPSGLFGEIQPNTIPTTTGFPGVSAQDLLDFYAASTAAATQHHRHQQQHQHHPGINNAMMDWSAPDQFGGYSSH
ncbi:putative Zinc finger transcription factor ace1 [Venustampulla echinocandica]|uniref:Putative Zinc finger transcription factor ace1 n=1 Tax=Venustampulla echinocandica TaxID=2656787 RepID=A0A370TSN5_9HELO|nr:putative Zinc finger transcription factor ace1 [Venustampulla echinocandica]RDL38541.1 putative Zinc finger transcription factor ace1 [Venustampulla echinocandica]